MTAPNQPNICPHQLSHLAIIEANGEDAGQFLQGQLTCNINELSEQKASIAAFCNPKGRMISTLLVVKIQRGFLLILPASLVDTVLKKLQMYVLRSKVKLTKADDMVLAGIHGSKTIFDLTLPEQDFYCTENNGVRYIKMPSANRFMCIAPSDAIANCPLASLSSAAVSEWRFQDISDGVPWFEAPQTEQYIPQMLNIDQLGGISFNKGCYTGQEIVARTHYLGKAKRQLYLAETNEILPHDTALAVIDAQSLEKCGDILAFESKGAVTRLLVVLQTVDDKSKNFILDNQQHSPIQLIPRQ